MSKTYLVKFTMEVCEEIEADSEEEAQQAFSELFGSPGEMVEDYGVMTAEELQGESNGFRYVLERQTLHEQTVQRRRC